MNPLAVLAGMTAAAAAAAAIAAKNAKLGPPPSSGGGVTLPAGTGGGTGGGSGGSSHSPPQVPPSGPPGLKYPLPEVGTMYRPNANLPAVLAYGFPGRQDVMALASHETEPGDAPKERHDNLMRWLDANELDPPQWVRIPVRDGLEVQVTADVVSKGGVRLCGPMRSSQYIADARNAMIPTPGIVDAIWKARSLTVAPQPFGWNEPSGWMNPGGGVPWLLYEADRVQEALLTAMGQLQATGADEATLSRALAGVWSSLSKDYVLEYRLLQNAGQCAIYGWHNTNGTVIQSGESGASYKHYLDFFDYSHCMRHVARKCWLNGAEMDLADVYKTKPDLVNWRAGEPAPPVRHPAFPPRMI